MAKRRQFITENGTIYSTGDLVVIDNHKFQIVGVHSPEILTSLVNRCKNLPTLDNCYSNPSQAKTRIYNYWCEFARYNAPKGVNCAFGIRSFNSMVFTFDCIITDTFDTFYAHITPTYNHLYVFGIELPQ